MNFQTLELFLANPIVSKPLGLEVSVQNYGPDSHPVRIKSWLISSKCVIAWFSFIVTAQEQIKQLKFNVLKGFLHWQILLTVHRAQLVMNAQTRMWTPCELRRLRFFITLSKIALSNGFFTMTHASS